MENGDPGAIVVFSTPDEIHQLLGLGAVANIPGLNIGKKSMCCVAKQLHKMHARNG